MFHACFRMVLAAEHCSLVWAQTWKYGVLVTITRIDDVLDFRKHILTDTKRKLEEQSVNIFFVHRVNIQKKTSHRVFYCGCLRYTSWIVKVYYCGCLIVEVFYFFCIDLVVPIIVCLAAGHYSSVLISYGYEIIKYGNDSTKVFSLRW
jgi:hypothetical protein